MSAKNFDIYVAKKYGTVRVSHGGTQVFPDSATVVSVQLHATVVFRLNMVNNILTLDTGGWRTVTTKAAINHALRQVGAYEGWFLASRKGEWFLEHGASGKRIEFYDGIMLGGGAGLPVSELPNSARKAA